MKKHILIVDDEVQIREILGQCLEAQGFRVTSTGTAIDAHRTVDTDPPDLLVSDLQLDESDGFELIAALKAKLPNLPVILLTGVLFDAETVRENLSQKVSSYIYKTTPLTRIVEEVRRLVGSS